MPAVTQQASAFVFSVTATLDDVGKHRQSLLGFEVRTLALSLTMSHASTLLGNHEAWPHKLPWQPQSAAT
jgi:hypothetical protein